MTYDRAVEALAQDFMDLAWKVAKHDGNMDDAAFARKWDAECQGAAETVMHRTHPNGTRMFLVGHPEQGTVVVGRTSWRCTLPPEGE